MNEIENQNSKKKNYVSEQNTVRQRQRKGGL